MRVPLLDAIVQRSSELVVVLDPRGVITYASASAGPLLGYAPSDLLDVDGFEFMHPDEVGALRDLFHAALAEPGIGIPFEVRLRAADGRWVPFEMLASNLIQDDDVRGMVFQGRDISKRKAVERELWVVQQQFEAVFVHAPLGIMLIDLDGVILDANDAACVLCGCTRHEVIGQAALDHAHPDDRSSVLEGTTEQLGGSNPTVEFRLVRTDGSVAWVASKAALVDPGIDDDPYVVVIWTDITEHRELEQRFARPAADRTRESYRTVAHS